MKTIHYAILWVALLLVGTPALRSQELPDVQVQDPSSKAIAIRSLLDGKTPIVLAFWSSTCKPCMKELDALTDNFGDWSEEVPFRIYAVSNDDSRSLTRAKAMPQGRGWDAFPFLYDVNQDLCRGLNITAIPYAVVIDKDGKIAYTHLGYMPGDEDALFEEVKKLSSPSVGKKKRK